MTVERNEMERTVASVVRRLKTWFVFICLWFLLIELVLVQASGGTAQAAATLSSLAAGAAGIVAIGAGAALVEESRRRRDKDKADSKREKTVSGYVSVFRNFYKFCRENGRPELVPAKVAKEKLKDPDIFNDVDHSKIAANEADIFSCFISWLGTNKDGSTSSASRQGTGRSGLVHYLKTRIPPRKLSEEAEISIEGVMEGHKRHVVDAKDMGLMRVR